MLRVALKATLAKKLRLLNMAIAVILGVAFLSGTFVFTDTIKRTFDDLFANIYDQTDSVVRSASSVEAPFGGAQRGRIPESLVATVRSVDGVAEVQPEVGGFAQLVGSNGKAIGNPGQGAPTLGMNYFGGVMSPWRLTPGSREPGPGEVVIDRQSATSGNLKVGDRVTVLTQTGPHQFTIVGTTRFGSVDSPGGASITLFDLPTAQDVMVGRRGELDSIAVAAVSGVSERDLTSRIAAVLPQGVEALTGTAMTREAQSDMRDAFSFFNTFLLVFAAVGLVVAVFTIYNTFQIVVTQRTREMALLRSIGATSGQVLGAQLIEALMVGVLASLLGLGAGVLVAGGLEGMLSAFGVDIPAGGTVLASRTVVVAIVVGTVVTVGSAVFPSLRASRVPPLAAIRDVAVETSSRWKARLADGLALTALGVAAFVAGLAGQGILWVGIGALLTFVGAFVLGPLMARPVTRLLGAPLPAVVGVTGALARENSMRNPKRTSRTGGALMVGVALVAGITVIAASARDWIHDVFDQQFIGDFVVATETQGFGGLSPTVAQRLNQLPEVGTATGVRVGLAHVREDASGTGKDTTYVSIDPATAGKVFDIGMRTGSVEALTPDGILLFEDEANRHHLGVGDQVDMRFVNGQTRTLTVEGIYSKNQLAGPFVISHALAEKSGADQFDFSVFVVKARGVSDESARAAIAQVSDAYPNAKLQSRSEYIAAQSAQINQLLNLMYGLLTLAIIIALLSIGNSMALSIHERTHEIGLLRAVGMSRRQTRRSVRWEAVLVALLGTMVGLVLGVFFGWSISVTLRDEGLGAFSLPVMSLVVIALLAVFGALVAAIRPARRAARLDVLRAIATE